MAVGNLNLAIAELSKNKNILTEISDICNVIRSINVDDNIKQKTASIQDFYTNYLNPLFNTFVENVNSSLIKKIQLNLMNTLSIEELIFDHFKSIVNGLKQIETFSQNLEDTPENIKLILSNISNCFKVFDDIDINDFNSNNINKLFEQIKSIKNNINDGIDDLLNDKHNILTSNVAIFLLVKRRIKRVFNRISAITNLVIDRLKNLEEIFEAANEQLETIRLNKIDKFATQVNNIIRNILEVCQNILQLSSIIAIIPVLRLYWKVFNTLFKKALVDIMGCIEQILIQINDRFNIKSTSVINKINSSCQNIIKICQTIRELSFELSKMLLIWPLIRLNGRIFISIINYIIGLINNLNGIDVAKNIYMDNLKNYIQNFIAVCKNLKLLSFQLLSLVPVLTLVIISAPIILLSLWIFKHIVNGVFNILDGIKVDKNAADMLCTSLENIYRVLQNVIKVSLLLVAMLPMVIAIPLMLFNFIWYFLVFKWILKSIIIIAKTAIIFLNNEFEAIFISIGSVIKTINKNIKINPILLLRLKFLIYTFQKLIDSILEIIRITISSINFGVVLNIYIFKLQLDRYISILNNIIEFCNTILDIIIKSIFFKRSIRKKIVKQIRQITDFIRDVMNQILPITQGVDVIQLGKSVMYFRVAVVLVQNIKQLYSSITGIMFGLFFKRNINIILRIVKFTRLLIRQINRIRSATLSKTIRKIFMLSILFKQISLFIFDIIVCAAMATLATIAATALVLAMFVIWASIIGIMMVINGLTRIRYKNVHRALFNIILIFGSLTLMVSALIVTSAIVVLGALVSLVMSAAMIIITLNMLILFGCVWILSKIVSKIGIIDLLKSILVLAIVNIMLLLLLATAIILKNLTEAIDGIDYLAILGFLGMVVVITLILTVVGWVAMIAAPILVPAAIAMIVLSVALLIIVGALYLVAWCLNQISMLVIDGQKVAAVIGEIFAAADTVINAIFQKPKVDDSAKESGDEPWWKSVLNWLGDSTVGKLVKALASMVYIAQILASIYMIKWIADCLNQIQTIQLKSADIQKGITTIFDTADLVIKQIENRKTKDLDKACKKLLKYEDIADLLEDIYAELDGIAYNPNISKQCMELVDMISQLNISFNDVDDKKITNAMKSYTNFLKQIDNTNIDKLKETKNVFEQMARFSESINGNFEALAETLNEKIAPLLEELKESLDTVEKNTTQVASRPTTTPDVEKQNIFNKMQESGQTKNLTKNEIEQIVDNKYKDNVQNRYGIDEIVSKLSALIDLFQNGDALVRTA